MAIDFKEELVRIEYVIGENTVKESISEEVPIPVDAKPDIEQVLEVTTNLRGFVSNVENGGVNINGLIEIGVMYVADTIEGDQPVHFFEGELTFNNFVDIPEAEQNMSTYVDIDILRASYNVVDARTVEVNVVLRKFAKVFDYRQINIISDVTGIREELVEKELLRIEDVIGENTYKTIVEGIIDIPEEKPPIERILKVSGGVVEKEIADVIEDGVIVAGIFESNIMYVADTTEGDQPVHFVEGDFNFTQVIDVPGVEPNMSAYTDITIKEWNYNIINGDQIEVRAVAEIFTKVTEPKQIEIVTDINSNRIEIEEELLRVEEVIGEDTVTETITESLTLPDAKPDIERILEANAQLFMPQCITEEGGVSVTGTIEAGILYVADTEEGDQPVHFFHEEFDFNNFVNIPETEPGMFCYGNVEIKRSNAAIGENNRTVEVTVTLTKFVKVTNFRQLTIVTDIIDGRPRPDHDECEEIEYTIRPGDTLYKLAQRYNTTVNAIINANNLANPNMLEVGQKLIIPTCIVDRPKG